MCYVVNLFVGVLWGQFGGSSLGVQLWLQEGFQLGLQEGFHLGLQEGKRREQRRWNKTLFGKLFLKVSTLAFLDLGF